ncbi:endonuclease [Bacteroidia bacterium]|nr:endonuclease [Bacteroidia bacterium]
MWLYSQQRIVAFYNLENLFDTIHDDRKNDYEYLPNSKKSWDTEKYFNKLHNMAYAISQIGEDSLRMPAVVGVAEVENVRVLNDLVKQPELNGRFKFILEESQDLRGIDVALLYQEAIFRPLYHKAYPLITDRPHFKTRNQLLVCGVIDGDTLFILVNHWSSRLGGQTRSNPNRSAAATLTKTIVEEILQTKTNAKILVMGDFNDDPTDSSIAVVLNAADLAQKQPNSEQVLYNPATSALKMHKGSLAYRGTWNIFDQIILSKGLIDATDKLHFVKYAICNEPFLLHQDGRYAGTPLRTYSGKDYLNGYSDHLPVFVILSQ